MNRTVKVRIVNGFVTPDKTGNPAHGGNPAGVVLDADALTEADMQHVAARVGHSETAFVSASRTEDFRFDFFTPTRRIAHCGHATIAAFSYMAALGRVTEGTYSKETVDGPRKIVIERGAAYMEQLGPRYETAEDWTAAGISDDHVLHALGLTADQVLQDVPPTLVNTGNSFVLVGVASSAVLGELVADHAAVEHISDRLDLIGFYVFATDAPGADAATRMFAPRYGIAEEAATGMAAGPLACLLRERVGVRKERMSIRQGRFMNPPSPSEIDVRLTLENGTIRGLVAGGFGHVMREMDVPLD